VAAEEMLRVFNCGVGMAVVVSDAEAATALLAAHGETVFPLGRIETAGDGETIRIDLPAGWLGT
jgi:phosphoribosylformylglycinamidine cyclo-ligase